MARLEGKIALVTGAARGIGAGIAEAFVREGARVLLSDVNEAGVEALAARLGAAALPARLDVREEGDWQSAVDQCLEHFGGLSAVVNNAGVTGFEAGTAQHDPENASLADWRAVHAVNLDGVFLGCKHAIRGMRESAARSGLSSVDGSIINIASRSGMVGIPGASAYASSKAAIRNHTKSVALYCAEQGLSIRCNVISPAAILTPMWEPLLGGPDATPQEREAAMAAFVSDTPLRRFGTVDEVAALAVLLASDEASYMTGAELTLDGGLLAGSAATPARSDET